MNDPEPLIPKHGGYRRLKSFQVSQLVYDVTVRFCNQYVEKRSRTHDQMVQAARSGVQNIAEGSEASATSKKTELKLTQVARASLEELRLDFEDFLRHRGLAMLDAQHPALRRFRALQPKTLHEVQAWVAEERRMVTDEQGLSRTHTDRLETVCSSVPVRGYQCSTILSSACLAANAALSLLNLACYLLDRQVAKLAADFENEGGFTERLYRVRTGRRNRQR
ncbi:MAG: four helix bundle protein [Chlorobiaceae bacterium]|nr:four helix bundle protein [Chlorobiaceae bacterium]NTV60694.1 four helix bundle protein [Chlorobiaceae bacterium]